MGSCIVPVQAQLALHGPKLRLDHGGLGLVGEATGSTMWSLAALQQLWRPGGKVNEGITSLSQHNIAFFGRDGVHFGIHQKYAGLGLRDHVSAQRAPGADHP